MFDQIRTIFAIDWRIFQTATSVWWQGGNPYGVLSPEFGAAGAFAYPPTALTWLSLFLPLGGAAFWVWSLLSLVAWSLTGFRKQAVLLVWSPVLVQFILGQSTLLVVLVIWMVYRAERRGWGCGLLLAFAMTKPQTALLPIAWLLWCERKAPFARQLWAGLLIGTLLLTLPPTLRDPGIWRDWLHSLGAYRHRIQQTAPWQGFGPCLLLPAAWLWHLQQKQTSANSPLQSIWPWWLTVALFPQTGLYPAVALLPVLHPRGNYWTIGGLALSSLLIAPVNGFTLPLILSGHILAGWLINGGPQPALSRQD